MNNTPTGSHEDKQVAQFLDLVQSLLGPNMIGAYLYGSSLVGGLQRYSDIDLLIVTTRPTTPVEKTKLGSEMLKILDCIEIRNVGPSICLSL